MKYHVSAKITCNTVAKQEAIFDKITTWLAGKPVWQNQVILVKDIDPTGKLPMINLVVRFEQLAHKDVVFEAIKAEVKKLTGVSIRLSWHKCYHDGDNRPCVPEEVFIK